LVGSTEASNGRLARFGRIDRPTVAIGQPKPVALEEYG
jgi:hypothetical protein